MKLKCDFEGKSLHKATIPHCEKYSIHVKVCKDYDQQNVLKVSSHYAVKCFLSMFYYCIYYITAALMRMLHITAIDVYG